MLSITRAVRPFTKCLNQLLRIPKPVEYVRYRSSTPMNTVVLFVPQQEAYIVERMGKYHRILQPGLNFLIPILDRIKYVQSLKEIAIDIPKQSAITVDNVTLNIDGVLYLRIIDPYKTSYGVEDPEFAITQLAQTTMRSEIGKLMLDSVFRERDSLNLGIVEAINKAGQAWGITCLRYEIRDIKLPLRVQEAMQMQVEAERKKRAAILESEGVREADINVAEGKKRARILASEALKMEEINTAQGQAQAIYYKAEAQARSLRVVADSLQKSYGDRAASLRIAEQYVDAFGKLAKTSNTILLPSNTGDVSQMVVQAMSVYQSMIKQTVPPGSGNPPSGTEPGTSGGHFDPAEYFSDHDENRPQITEHQSNEGQHKDGLHRE